jgi:hypothetical protein
LLGVYIWKIKRKYVDISIMSKLLANYIAGKMKVEVPAGSFNTSYSFFINIIIALRFLQEKKEAYQLH